jgi:tetratricopeptide (TPR) repeat protein
MAREPATTSTKRKAAPRKRAAPKAAAAAPQVEEKPAKARIGLPHVEAASTRLRTVLLNFAFVGAFLIIVPVIISQFWRDEVLIDRMPVPAALADLGLTPEVAANRLWDGIRDATLRANTSKSTVTALPDAQRIEFTLPESGFSMESLVQQTRAFFHAYQTRIGGEFTCADPKCEPAGMRLRLRVVRETTRIIDMPPIGTTPLREYFTDAGVQVLSVLDPFVAVASIAETEPLRATVLARNLIRQKHPDAKWAHVLIGIMKDGETEIESSIAEFRAALALDPDFFIARRNLAARLVVAGQLEAANAEYGLLTKAWPNRADVIAGLGELAFAQQRYDEADALFARAEALEPRQPLYVARRGDAALAKGDVETGIAHLERALRMDPGFVPAMGSLTKHFFGAGDIAAAEPLLADYAEIAPDLPDAQAMYGQLLRLKGNAEAALVHLAKARDLAPADPEIAETLAKTHVELGQLDRAERIYLQMVAADPERAETHAALGQVHAFMGLLPDAVENWKKAAELAPDNAAYVAGVGEALMYSKRYNEALVQFDRALEIDPARPETWSFRGATLKYMGRREEAVASLEKFLELSKDQFYYGPMRDLAEADIAALKAEAP